MSCIRIRWSGFAANRRERKKQEVTGPLVFGAEFGELGAEMFAGFAAYIMETKLKGVITHETKTERVKTVL